MVGENGLASVRGEKVDGAERGELEGAGVGVGGEEEDAAGAGPELAEAGVRLVDVGRVGPEASIPEAVDAAIEEMDLLTGVEDQGGA